MIKKRIALIATIRKREELVDWARFSKFRLAACELATHTTGN